MQGLSPEGRQAVDDIARRHGFSSEAVTAMLWAVVQGNGSMAQFGHPEFGGAGQWMRGGMTMVSDLFNHALKARVDSLCNELAALVSSQPGLVQGGSFQSQSQGSGSAGAFGAPPSSWSGSAAQPQPLAGGQPSPGAGAPSGMASLFVPGPAGADWWGAGLGRPDATGAQNGVRYAYFAQTRRLAIEVHGRVTLYDTGDHRIGGFSQQQSGSGSLSFTSQHGLVDVAQLPVVSGDAQVAAAPAAQSATTPAAAGNATAPASPGAAPGSPQMALPQGLDVLAAIDKLAELHARGVLTAEEFSAKKAELLSRL